MEAESTIDFTKLIDDILRLSYKSEKFLPSKTYLDEEIKSHNVFLSYEQLTTDIYHNWRNYPGKRIYEAYNSPASAFMEGHFYSKSKYYYEIDAKDFFEYRKTCIELKDTPSFLAGSSFMPVFPGLYDSKGEQAHFINFSDKTLCLEIFGIIMVHSVSILSTKYKTGQIGYRASIILEAKFLQGPFHDALINGGLSTSVVVLYQFYQPTHNLNAPPTEALLFFDEKKSMQYFFSCGFCTGEEGDAVVDLYCCQERKYELKRHFSNVEREKRREILHNNFLSLLDHPYTYVYIFKYLEYRLEITVDKKVQIGTIKKKKKSRSGNPQKRDSDLTSPIYKIVKSIKINYEKEEEILGKEYTKRSHSSPTYVVSVQGFWRKLKYEHSIGHDQSGDEVIGKTWVIPHERYKNNSRLDNGKQIGQLDVVQNPPINNPIIKIKQTIASAKDIAKSYEVSKQQETTQPDKKYPDIKAINTAKDGSVFKEEENVEKDNENSKSSSEFRYNERIKLTSAIRYKIFTRDDFKCCLCGISAENDNNVKLEVDHIIPVSKWGRTEENNLQTLCNKCNRGKSDEF